MDADNQMTDPGYGYDLNGNLTTMPGPGGCSMTLTYDPYNRVSTVDGSGTCGDDDYGYAPDGRRVWKRSDSGTTEERFYLYGITGNLLREYEPDDTYASGLQPIRTYRYFGSKRIGVTGSFGEPSGSIVTDRLGSVVHRGESPIQYYPYGEERTSTLKRPPQIRHLLPRHHLRAGLRA